MAVDQLPVEVREFVDYLDGLMARLDPRGGWYAVFWGRDPDGMRACLDGREVPPWDVVEAFLQDLASMRGPDAAEAERTHARLLHTAALAAYDARPGARDALSDRLAIMLREQRYATERQMTLGRSLATAGTAEQADTLRGELAWARDDHRRATARCAELRSRIANLDALSTGGRHPGATDDRRIPNEAAPAPGHGFPTIPRSTGHGFPAIPRPAGPGFPRPVARGGPTPSAYTAETAGGAAGAAARAGFDLAARTDPAWPDRTAGAGRTARGRTDAPDRSGDGSPDDARRIPGFLNDGRSVLDSPNDGRSISDSPNDAPRPADPTPGPPAPAPGVSAPAGTAKPRRRRRGSARFAGMDEDAAAVPAVVPQAAAPVLPAAAPAGGRVPRGARFAGAAGEAGEAEPRAERTDPQAGREVAAAVGRLERLRAEGRSGEAHALLADIARWPAGRLPLLAAALHDAGLGADWTTLLWEAAALPADLLVEAADVLESAGRTADGQQILRQGVARPAEEIGEAALLLAARGHRRGLHALLDAYVRVRAPEEAARSAGAGPEVLVPLLLEAAQGVSDERHWDLVHALRVAGFAA